MAVPALRSNAKTSAYLDFDSDEDYAPVDLYSGDRICPPRVGSGGNAMLRAYIVIFVALGGGWALLGNQATWQGWLRAATSAVSSSMNGGPPRSVELAASAAAPTVPPANAEPPLKPVALDPPPSTPQPLQSSEIAAAPGAAAGVAACTTDDRSHSTCGHRLARDAGPAIAAANRGPIRSLPEACGCSRPAPGSVAGPAEATIADRLSQCWHCHSDRRGKDTRRRRLRLAASA